MTDIDTRTDIGAKGASEGGRKADCADCLFRYRCKLGGIDCDIKPD